MPDDGCCWSRTVPPCYCRVMSSSSATVSPVTVVTPVTDAHGSSEFTTARKARRCVRSGNAAAHPPGGQRRQADDQVEQVKHGRVRAGAFEAFG